MNKTVALLLVLIILIAATAIATKSVRSSEEATENSWTIKAPIQIARAHIGVAVVNERIYVIGGDAGSEVGNVIPGWGHTYNVVSNNEEYDPATNTWETKTPPPCELTSYASVVVDDKIYFIGAYTNSSGLRTGAFFQIYDPESDTWSTGTEAPTYGIGAGLGATTGLTAPKQISVFEETTTYTYDFTADSWAINTSMPTARLIVGVAVVNDTFYVVGGRSGQHGYITMMYPSSVNEQYTPIGYETPNPTTPSPSPKAQDPEPFPTALVATASGASATIIGIGLLVYFKKRQKLRSA